MSIASGRDIASFIAYTGPTLELPTTTNASTVVILLISFIEGSVPA